MTQSSFAPGTPVCYKCGSPTFLVLKDDPKEEDVLISWFDTTKNEPCRFRVDRILIETIEDFQLRKIRIEALQNKRLYEIPAGIELDNILLIGFLSADHKQAFMDKMFTEEAEGHVFNKDPKPQMN
jgi:hypothetical protein